MDISGVINRSRLIKIGSQYDDKDKDLGRKKVSELHVGEAKREESVS